MVNSELNRIFKQILRGLPGVLGILVVNKDGKPIYVDGRFDIPVQEFGAWVAVCFASAEQAGFLFDRELYSILTEYKSLKLFHVKISNEYILSFVLKINDVYLGEIRRKINEAIKDICKDDMS